MTDKEKELLALKEEYLRRDEEIQNKYPVDINNIQNFLYDESVKARQIKALNKWFKEELNRINEKYEK